MLRSYNHFRARKVSKKKQWNLHEMSCTEAPNSWVLRNTRSSSSRQALKSIPASRAAPKNGGEVRLPRRGWGSGGVVVPANSGPRSLGISCAAIRCERPNLGFRLHGFSAEPMAKPAAESILSSDFGQGFGVTAACRWPGATPQLRWPRLL